MKKTLALFFVMTLVSVSCSKSGGGSDGSAEIAQAPVTIDNGTENSETDPDTDIPDSSSGSGSGSTTTPGPVSTLPALALSFSTNVGLLNFSSTQEEKYNKAVEIVKLVVATEEFRTQVLNHTYSGKKTFVDNNGLTNAQIYQTILNAAEKLQPSKNNRMDLDVELYYENSTTVGYTYSSVTQIWVNTKYFNQYAANSVAGNLFHEWLHKLGYGHDSAATASRPYSVPYAIGYMISNIGKKFL